jgi:hypothetical protein
MVQQADLLLPVSTSCQDGMCYSVCGFVELGVCEFDVPAFDCQPLRMLTDLILEPVRNRVLYFLLLKFDKTPSVMKTFGTESLLCWCKTRIWDEGMLHLYTSISVLFFRC